MSNPYGSKMNYERRLLSQSFVIIENSEDK